MNKKEIFFVARNFVICVVMLFVFVGTAIGEISREGVVVEYHFDGDTIDSSGNGNNANNLGATFVDGISGKALSFNGVNDYVDAGNIASFEVPFTIEVWVYPAKSQEKCWDEVSGNYGIMSNLNSLDSSTNWVWQLRYGDAGGGCYLGFQFNDNTEGNKWVTIKQKLTTGHWYQIVGTFDGTNIIVYLNGNPKDKNQISKIIGNSDKLLIGNDGWGNYFNGNIDEIRIYNRALSASEIMDNYNAIAFTPSNPPTPTTTPTSSPTSSMTYTPFPTPTPIQTTTTTPTVTSTPGIISASATSTNIKLTSLTPTQTPKSGIFHSHMDEHNILLARCYFSNDHQIF